MSSNWQNWCRLCAKYENSNIGQFIPITSITDLDQIVQKYFLISVAIPNLNQSICIECYEFLTTLEKYADRCRSVDKMFIELSQQNRESSQMSDNDILSLRYKYGIDFIEQDDNYAEINKSILNNKVADDEDLKSRLSKPQPIIQLHNGDERMRKRRGRPKKTESPILLKIEQIDTDQIPDDIDVPDFDVDDSQNDPSYDIETQLDDYDDDLDDDLQDGETELAMKKQRRRIKRDTPIVCASCNEEFTVQRQFDAHMKSHHPEIELPFVCSKCPKRFSTQIKVQRHEFVHLPDEEKLLHPCPYCDKRFSKAVNVQAHVRAIHIGDRPFICEECGKSFGTKGALKEHQIIHSNEFPYECQHCPKKFKNLARLRTHADIHKDTIYVCPHCGLQLNTKRTLKMHMVVHSDQKKYKCQYCGNEYKRSKALKNHLILHTGLRPYTCPFCEKTFANGSNCRSHKKKAHPAELAALEASGEITRATNIPKLEHLQPKKELLAVQNNIDDVMETIQNDEIIIPSQLFN